jgi:hypothetical protein
MTSQAFWDYLRLPVIQALSRDALLIECTALHFRLDTSSDQLIVAAGQMTVRGHPDRALENSVHPRGTFDGPMP